MASRLQTAMQERKVGKAYDALLTGELTGAVTVDQPLGNDTASPIFIKSAVCADGQPSVTRFECLSHAGGFTLAKVTTETGRKHQIRAHAQWLGHSVVGDKIYVLDTTDKTALATLNQQAGKNASVTGTLNGDTIEVSSVVAK